MKKIILSAAATLLMTSASAFAAANNSPPSGAIIDLGGVETGTAAQAVFHGGGATAQTESVTFVAGVANTDITFALREDPAFFMLSNITLINNTTSSGNLILNGNFASGSGNNATDWTFDNVFGAGASGVVSTSCGTVFATCWRDGSIQAYDAIDQVVATTVGNSYTLSFQYWDNGGLTTMSDLSTNGDTSDTGGNGIDILAYALAGLPAACTPGIVCTNPTTGVPEPITLTLFGAGLVGAGVFGRRKAKKSA